MKKTKKSSQLCFIGEIRTSFSASNPPPRPFNESDYQAQIIIFPEFQEGLKELERFKYIYVLFYLDQEKGYSLTAHPPSAKGKEVGVFASRSPHRPTPIGLSVVRLKEIKGNVVITDGIDAYDRSPVLDLKPYFLSYDAKNDANNGWREEIENQT